MGLLRVWRLVEGILLTLTYRPSKIEGIYSHAKGMYLARCVAEASSRHPM